MKRFPLTLCLVALLSISTLSNAQIVGTISVGDITVSAEKNEFRSNDRLVSAITTGLNAALIKSRKFNVLSYAEVQNRLKRQGRTLSGYYSNAYKNDSYDQAGLDYILTANASKFNVSKQTLGNSQTTVSSLDVEFKLYGVADVTEDKVDNVSAQLSATLDWNNSDDLQDLIDASVQKAVDIVTDKVISDLFPIRVIKMSEEGVITLNYGEGLLSPGDTVMIYPTGTDVTLSDSGEPVGEAIATLKIITTERKFSMAQSLNGYEQLEKGQQGILLRPDNEKVRVYGVGLQR